MADYPKLDMDSSSEAGEGGGLALEENMEGKKISVFDHINGFQCTKEKSDSFVIDMERFSHGINKDINTNSRITLQRSHSRKGSPRGAGGGEKKINSNLSHLSVSDRDAIVASASPRGPRTPEKAAVVTVGTADHSCSPQLHHQITITTGNMNATPEGRCIRRNSFKRSSPSWVLDPKRVLFFFATLSSMGTMLLIYLTLSIGKLNAIDNSLD
ncbi:PROTEIN putative-RELATED [Salix koriyanagi]|uniref:PROTEIN putative-RELATED n=1 Tax=Salix koriyanagi TaxID=2511006 RepID=A0A9Q0UEY5_9ROSI|nr:PROTEIN putative-RELATED [Salix koriyanagi]